METLIRKALMLFLFIGGCKIKTAPISDSAAINSMQNFNGQVWLFKFDDYPWSDWNCQLETAGLTVKGKGHTVALAYADAIEHSKRLINIFN